MVKGIHVAGKTGTSHNPHGDDHAVFAGFAPLEAPRVAVYDLSAMCGPNRDARMRARFLYIVCALFCIATASRG